MHRSRVLCAAGFAVFFLPLACTTPSGEAAFEVGMSREAVVERFGAPQRHTSIRKTDEPIWGAIEDFWETVPVGSLIEIWYYAVEGGTVELYFVDGAEAVGGKAFAPEGAVYEAEPGQ